MLKLGVKQEPRWEPDSNREKWLHPQQPQHRCWRWAQGPAAAASTGARQLARRGSHQCVTARWVCSTVPWVCSTVPIVQHRAPGLCSTVPAGSELLLLAWFHVLAAVPAQEKQAVCCSPSRKAPGWAASSPPGWKTPFELALQVSSLYLF